MNMIVHHDISVEVIPHVVKPLHRHHDEVALVGTEFFLPSSYAPGYKIDDLVLAPMREPSAVESFD